jgi:hypothetical protein
MFAELHDLGQQPHQHSAGRHQPITRVAIGIVRLINLESEGFGKLGDHRGIDRVVFGQPAGDLAK